MLINLSNHPVTSWDEKQKNAASAYGQLFDLPFPVIDPMASSDDIANLAAQYEIKIRHIQPEKIKETFAVHIMGELTFCFALIARLQQSGISCIASTTTRETEDNQDGSKTVKFGFVGFREYAAVLPFANSNI